MIVVRRANRPVLEPCRAMDILESMKNAAVSVSVAFNDDDIRRLFEANTINTEARVSCWESLKQELFKFHEQRCLNLSVHV